MEDRIKYSLLLDLYGEMFTTKQIEILEYYYNDDLSLSEISELSNISRQAVFDAIKKCNKQLMNYESKIHMYEKISNINKLKSNIFEHIDVLELNISDKKLKNELKEMKKIMGEF